MQDQQQSSFELVSQGKSLKLEIGQYAKRANGSVLAVYGNTAVLATVVMGKLDKEKDYFPLSVEYIDKLYAGGYLKDSKWQKREGGLKDESVLLGRIIDRSIRPLFPQDFRNEVQVIVTVLANDKENHPIIPAFNAVSVALAVSNIPFNSAVSAVRVARKEGKLIFGPTYQELLGSDLDLIVCTGPSGVNMIEAEASILPDDIVLTAIEECQNVSQEINLQILDIVKNIGNPKIAYTSCTISDDIYHQIEDLISSDCQDFCQTGMDNGLHEESQSKIVDKVMAKYDQEIKSDKLSEIDLKLAVDSILRSAVRKSTLEGKRFDNRKNDEIRPLSAKASIIPCVHGSALFNRGLTQALTITTLGSLAQKLYVSDSFDTHYKNYIHYYSGAPFSTGQAGNVGRTGRREIGHGALAEKALRAVIPSVDDFPYTIFVNSEVLSQNGSSSMASTCGSTLSLMDAGVPIKDMVGGVSIGMISDGDKYTLLTDIAGIEDHFGDMDFKIAGTKTGITAIQLDVKRPGLTMDMIRQTFQTSATARLKVLDVMSSVLDKPRSELSATAPKIEIVRLPEDKVGEVIGSGGKNIKALAAKHDVTIDIDDEGIASISSLDIEKVKKCAKEIYDSVRDLQIGEEFDAPVVRIESYGVFVELTANRDALLHVSKMSNQFVKDPSSLVKMGQIIHVRIDGLNENGQYVLSAPLMKSVSPTVSTDSAGKNRISRYKGQ